MTPFIDFSAAECAALGLCWIASIVLALRLFKDSDWDDIDK